MRQTFEALARPLVTGLLSGQSSVLLTFGVTNSGKSHTILGKAGTEAAGVVPRLFDAILSGLAAGSPSVAAASTPYSAAPLLSFACLEVYNDRYFDLLSAPGSAGASGADSAS